MKSLQELHPHTIGNFLFSNNMVDGRKRRILKIGKNKFILEGKERENGGWFSLF